MKRRRRARLAGDGSPYQQRAAGEFRLAGDAGGCSCQGAMKRIPLLIIGAGPTGLGAAWRAHELGREDWLLAEGAEHAGGLAASFVDERGFTWDVGGHVQFSHYVYFDQVMDRLLGRDGWLEHDRESWVWMRGRFVPYPFQNNIHRLPAEEYRDAWRDWSVRRRREPRRCGGRGIFASGSSRRRGRGSPRRFCCRII